MAMTMPMKPPVIPMTGIDFTPISNNWGKSRRRLLRRRAADDEPEEGHARRNRRTGRTPPACCWWCGRFFRCTASAIFGESYGCRAPLTSCQPLRDAAYNIIPLSRRCLPEQNHRRIPGIIGTLQHPPPVGRSCAKAPKRACPMAPARCAGAVSTEMIRSRLATSAAVSAKSVSCSL